MAEGIEALAGEFRGAGRRCLSLAPEDRRRALRLWLAHRLRGRASGELRGELRDLAEALAEGASPPATATAPPSRTASASRERDALFAFGRAYHGSAWEDLPEAERCELAALALAELVPRLRALSGPGSEDRPVSAVLTELEFRASSLDGAVRRSAQESFDRLLESLSPGAVETGAGKRGVKLGVFRKADLYEAWVEKHAQLDEYHRAGRLVGDFRALLRRNLKAGAGEKEGE